jgi:transposase
VGSKNHVLTDAGGLPLAVSLTDGHRNDVTQLIPLVDAVALMEVQDGLPHARPERLIADRGYDHDKHRMLVRERGIEPVVAWRRTEHGSGQQKGRGTLPGSFSWHANIAVCRYFFSRRCGVRTSDLLLVREEKDVAEHCRLLQNPHT